MPNPSDEELLQLISHKDQEAMLVFYDRYFAKVQGLCRRTIQNQGLADETVQDVFWTVWQNAAKFDKERASASTWLLIIARSRSMDALRKVKNAIVAAPLEEIADEVADGRDVLVDDVLAGMDRAALKTAMKSLPDNQSAVVADVYLIGFSAPEVARARGLPLGTVKTRLRLGLEKLRGMLVEEVGDAE